MKPPQRAVHASFLDQFAAQVRRDSEATALVSATTRLTYAELDARSNQLARFLRSLGVAAECAVALFLRRSGDVPVAILGVLKAGGAYLVLDTSDPVERIAAILDDAQPPVVIAHGSLVDLLPAHWGYAFALDAVTPLLAAQNDAALDEGVHPCAAASIIYTSGSTGRPKGVVTPHRALAQRAGALAASLELGPRDTQLQLLNLSFDGSSSEIFPVLAAGGTLVVPSERPPLSAAAILEACAREDVSTLTLTPAYWHAITRDLRATGRRLPATVRSVQVGGDRIAFAALAAWRTVSDPSTRFWNLYGPTEATIVALAHQSTIDDDGETWLPIGVPLPETDAHVLDEALRPVCSGETGELYIGGTGLARGYHARPGATALAFVPDPFAVEPGARLYRTGDLVRCDERGHFHFAGRADRQVKFRDYRIELGEVEAALGGHPAVRAAVALIERRGASAQRLIAFALRDAEHGVTPEELQRFAAARVPAHLVPERITIVDAFPLTPSGKIHYDALADHRSGDARANAARRAPRDAREAALRRIWSHVLERRDVGPHDDFLELGGNSLLAVQIAARASETFDLEVPVVEVFRRPTVAELAQFVAERTREGRSLPTALGDCAPPLVAAAAPALGIALRLVGAVSRPALERALATVVSRYAILGAPPSLESVALHASGAEEREVEARAAIAGAARHPFDRAVALRAYWLAVHSDLTLFALLADPLACDQRSAEIVARELLACYEADVTGQPSPLDAPAADYPLGARLDRPLTAAAATPATSTTALRVSRELLRHVDALIEPALRPAALVPGLALAALADSLQGAASADFLALLQPRGAAAELVGPVCVPLFVEAALSGGATLRDLLESVRDQVLAAERDPAGAYRAAVQAAARAAHAEQPGLRPALAVLPDADVLPLQVDGVTVEPVEPAVLAAAPPVSPGFDLVLAVRPDEDGLELSLTAPSGSPMPAALDTLLAACGALLDALAAEPDAPAGAAAARIAGRVLAAAPELGER